MSGHYISVNDHAIFGYCRYAPFYADIVANAADDSTFVEVGSFLGQSTAVMADCIKRSGKRISFYAIDLFRLSDFSDEPHYDAIREHGGDFYAAFMANLTAAQVQDAVRPLVGESAHLARAWHERSIDFLMIDAAHDYDNVLLDIKSWMPAIKIGGIVSGDDYDFEQVGAAVRDCIDGVQLYNSSTWFKRKTKEMHNG